MFKIISAFIGKESAKMEKASGILKNICYFFMFLAIVCLYNIFDSSGFLSYLGLIFSVLVAWQTFSFSKKLDMVVKLGRKAAAFADSADEVQTLSKEVYEGIKNGELDPDKLDEIAYKSKGIVSGIKQSANELENSNIRL